MPQKLFVIGDYEAIQEVGSGILKIATQKRYAVNTGFVADCLTGLLGQSLGRYQFGTGFC